jgi:hypothetical protein
VSNPEEPGQQRTVIVTLDLESHLFPALELALALAAVRRGALHGLFIEDEDLLQVAELPFAAEVPRLGGPPRALESRQLQRSLEKSAARFRELLAQQAEQRALNWSYSRIRGRRYSVGLDEPAIRGRRYSVGLDEPASAEYLVMSQPQGRRPWTEPTLRLLLIRDHSAGCLQALRVILEQNAGRPVALQVVAEPGEGSPLENPALLQLLELYPEVGIQPLLPSQLPEAMARGSGFHCIVTSRSLDPQTLQGILRRATCPVIVAS